jgi:pimeloyl-ACP methyl ester carboxylesterase
MLYGCGQKVQTIKPFENSHFANVNGTKLHYRVWNSKTECNEKPWILLVHGFSGSTYSWQKNVESLTSNGYNVVAVDVPPFGYSDKSPTLNLSADNKADLLWKFANAINPNTQWHLFGHSMGGGIVAALAILQPDKVEKVVFVAPALFGRLNQGRSFRQKLIAFTPVELTLSGLGSILLIRKGRVEKFIESAYGEKPSHEDILGYYTPLNQKGMARAILSSFSRANPIQAISITSFKSQSLAIWGENDTWVPFSNMKPYTEEMENLTIVIIKDTGHNPMETDSAVFNKLVLEFLLQEHNN